VSLNPVTLGTLAAGAVAAAVLLLASGAAKATTHDRTSQVQAADGSGFCRIQAPDAAGDEFKVIPVGCAGILANKLGGL
jgi:hypothetical protein